MTPILLFLLKILCAAVLAAAAFAVLFVLNALRVAAAACLRRPIRKYCEALAEREDYVPYRAIPMEAETVLIAVEDYAFLSHPGFSLQAIREAVRRNRREKREKDRRWGGSTITQQLVKNLYLYPKKEARCQNEGF